MGGDIEPPGVDQRRHRRVRRVGHVHGGDLDDPVLVLAQTRRLQVERDHDGGLRRSRLRGGGGRRRARRHGGHAQLAHGRAPSWGVENEDPEDPPASPHAEARFVSVAGAFSRRCAPLFARWRGGAAAGGFADAGGATPAAPPREPPRDAPRRARAGTTPNPASVGVGPFRSRPWRRRRPPRARIPASTAARSAVPCCAGAPALVTSTVSSSPRWLHRNCWKSANAFPFAFGHPLPSS